MKRKGMLALAVAAVAAAGTGSAIAAGTGAPSTKPTDDAWVQALAKRLGTTPDKLVAALQGAANDRIDQLVKDGLLTQARADALKARIAATGGLGFGGGFDGPGRGWHGMGGLGVHGAIGNPLAAAATYLGMSAADLDTALDSGKTLADVAKEKGKTTDGLKAAMVTAVTAQVNARTDLTDAQKKALIDRFSARADLLISSALGHGRRAGAGPLGGPGFGPGPWRQGRGMHGGLWDGGGPGTGASLHDLRRGGRGAGPLSGGGTSA